MKPATDHQGQGHAESRGQTGQRVKVGMTGLAIVLLLIALASVVFNAANRGDQALVAANGMLAANSPDANAADPLSEPLTELGVSPSTQSDGANAAATATRGRR